MQKNPGNPAFEMEMQKQLWKIKHFGIGNAEKNPRIWKIQHFEIGNSEKAENPAILKLEFGTKSLKKNLKLAEKE